MADTLTQYLKLRRALAAEKADIEKRLAQIGEALGETASAGPRSAEAPALKRSTTYSAKAVRLPASKAKPKAGPALGRGRRGNPMSLKAAVRAVAQKKALTKPEILTEVGKLGYRFATKNPVGSLNSILYASGDFKNMGSGKFKAV
jgi:hypothetical protein